jgi:hypothetical protein
LLLVASTALAAEQAATPGHIDIRSSLVGARVYIDDTYVGDADLFVEDVSPGSHMITLRQGSQRIFGQFTVKPGETIMLEGRFEENRVVDLREVAREAAAKRAEEEREAEAERKAQEAEHKKREPAAATAKHGEKKKPEPKRIAAGAALKSEKSAEEERQDLHVNLIRVDFAGSDSNFDVTVTPKLNQKVITNFSDSKGSTGKLIRTKQGTVLCEQGSCVRDWTGRFFYIDEAGKRDAFLIRWRETVFTGVTPDGTSKVVLDICLNGECKSYPDRRAGVNQSRVDRYIVSWTDKAFVIRRADIVKEITDAGGKVPDF